MSEEPQTQDLVPLESIERGMAQISTFVANDVRTWGALPGYQKLVASITSLANLWAFSHLGARVAQALTQEVVSANAPLVGTTDTEMSVEEAYVLRIRSRNVLYEDLAYLHVLAQSDPLLGGMVKSLGDVLRMFRVTPLDGTVARDVIRLTPEGVVKTLQSEAPPVIEGADDSLDLSLSLESYKTLASFLSDVVQQMGTVAGQTRLAIVDAHKDMAGFSTQLITRLLGPHLPQLSPREVMVYSSLVSEVVLYGLSEPMGVAASGASVLEFTNINGVLPRQILSFDGAIFRYLPEPFEKSLDSVKMAVTDCEAKLKNLKSRLYTEIKINMKIPSGEEEFGDLLDT